MANNMFGARMTSLVELPVASATVIEQGNLVYWDSTANEVKNLSEQADDTDEATNQTNAAAIFLGSAHAPSNDGDTTVIVDTGRNALLLDMPTVSATYRAFTLLGPSENASGDGLLDQKLEAVPTYARATHVVMSDSASARTTVTCAPIKSVAYPIA